MPLRPYRIPAVDRTVLPDLKSYFVAEVANAKLILSGTGCRYSVPDTGICCNGWVILTAR